MSRYEFSTLFARRLLSALPQQILASRCVHIAFAREFIPILSAVLAIVFKRRLIVQPHGMLTVGARQSAARRVFDAFFVRPVLRRASVVIALTEVERYALTTTYGLEGKGVVVVGNGLNLAVDPFISSRPRALTAVPEVLFCGRLHPRKRVVDFIEAARLDRSKARWVIVGPDGGELDMVLGAVTRGEVASEPPVEPNAVAHRVDQAAVFVLCSENEPWGNVVVTALGLHVPVVITRSADLAGLVDSSGAGIVVDDRDPAAIAGAVEHILSSDENYTGFSRNAGELARRQLSEESTGRLLLSTTPTTSARNP